VRDENERRPLRGNNSRQVVRTTASAIFGRSSLPFSSSGALRSGATAQFDVEERRRRYSTMYIRLVKTADTAGAAAAMASGSYHASLNSPRRHRIVSRRRRWSRYLRRQNKSRHHPGREVADANRLPVLNHHQQHHNRHPFVLRLTPFIPSNRSLEGCINLRRESGLGEDGFFHLSPQLRSGHHFEDMVCTRFRSRIPPHGCFFLHNSHNFYMSSGSVLGGGLKTPSPHHG